MFYKININLLIQQPRLTCSTDFFRGLDFNFKKCYCNLTYEIKLLKFGFENKFDRGFKLYTHSTYDLDL